MQVLLDCMNRLLELHRTLTQLAERQRQALIHGDTETIQALVLEMDATVQMVFDTEEQRINITSALASTYGIAVTDLTAERLANELDTVSGARLLRLVRELRDQVIFLDEANLRNQLLTEQSVHYINSVVAMIAGAVRSEGYGPGRSPRQSVRLFDSQA